MARRRKIALPVVACLVVLAGLAWLNRPRDEPARATVDEAIQSFRAETDAGGNDGGAGEPALGVYRYATRGSESVTTPIASTTHGYDGISTIVISPGRCGEQERWQVLAGRWSEAEACTAEQGSTAATVTEFHEFFGVGQEDSFRCHSGPVPQRAGVPFTSSCESDDSTIHSTVRVLGSEPVSVGDQTYDAFQIESQSVLGGHTSGTAKRNEWRRRSDGLLLRRSTSSEANTSDAGGSHYEERYTIELLSTKPQR